MVTISSNTLFLTLLVALLLTLIVLVILIVIFVVIIRTFVVVVVVCCRSSFVVVVCRRSWLFVVVVGFFRCRCLSSSFVVSALSETMLQFAAPLTSLSPQVCGCRCAITANICHRDFNKTAARAIELLESARTEARLTLFHLRCSLDAIASAAPLLLRHHHCKLPSLFCCCQRYRYCASVAPFAAPLPLPCCCCAIAIAIAYAFLLLPALRLSRVHECAAQATRAFPKSANTQPELQPLLLPAAAAPLLSHLLPTLPLTAHRQNTGRTPAEHRQHTGRQHTGKSHRFITSTTDDSGHRIIIKMNSFFFAASTVNRLDAMVNIIPRWIRKDGRCDGDKVKWDNEMPQFGLIFEINCADDGDICRKTTNLHRGVTYQNEEKDMAETMKHYGGAAKC